MAGQGWLSVRSAGASLGLRNAEGWKGGTAADTTPAHASMTSTVWPSGLRRWLQAPVRKGVGSNPTAVMPLAALREGGGAGPKGGGSVRRRRRLRLSQSGPKEGETPEREERDQGEQPDEGQKTDYSSRFVRVILAQGPC